VKIQFLKDFVGYGKLFYRGSVYAVSEKEGQAILKMDPPVAHVLVRKSAGGPPFNKMMNVKIKNKEQ